MIAIRNNYITILQPSFAIPLSVTVSKGENFRSPAFFTKWWLNFQKIVEQLIDWNFE